MEAFSRRRFYFSISSLLLPLALCYFSFSSALSLPSFSRERAKRGAAGAAPWAHLCRRALGGQQGAAGAGSSPGPAPGPVDPAAAGAREGASSPAPAGLKGGGRSVPAARSAALLLGLWPSLPGSCTSSHT